MPFPVELSPPLADLAAKLEIRPEDIEEHFIRGAGSGGQKINKTNNCVMLIHRPTGTEVRVQKHREQVKNRKSAYKLLILKIDALKRGKESKLAQKAFKLRKQKQRRSRKSKEKMLREKHQRAEIKEGRQKVL